MRAARLSEVEWLSLHTRIISSLDCFAVNSSPATQPDCQAYTRTHINRRHSGVRSTGLLVRWAAMFCSDAELTSL